MVDKLKIHELLHDYFWNANTEWPLAAHEYEIDDDGLVHINDADVMCKRIPPEGRLPISFGEVQGDFLVEDMQLTTLLGAPTKVSGMFSCKWNQLITLKHAPTSCAVLDCGHNMLTSLRYAPKVLHTIHCDHNELTDLSTVQAVRHLDVMFNPLENCRQIAPHMGRVTISYSKELPMLGLLAATEIRVLHEHEADYMVDLGKILNKYCVGEGGGDKASMLKCAAELIRAGYKENARW